MFFPYLYTLGQPIYYQGMLRVILEQIVDEKTHLGS